MTRVSNIEKRILGEAYSSIEAMKNLGILCDDFGGRFAGTEENRAAAEFILDRFESYGFENPHLETFKFLGCTVGPSTLEIIEPIKREIPCLTLPMTESGEVEGDLVYTGEGSGISEEQVGDKVALGLVRLPFIRDTETDVAGFIWMHPYPAMGPPTGCINSSVPAVSVKFEYGQMMRRLLRRYGSLEVRIHTECDIFERDSWNVCGEIPSRGDSDEFILLGGHYDGHEIAQAAFDCGAACMAVTEMGRILNMEREHLDRKLRIVCFSAEEFGWHGSQAYAERHSNEMGDMRFTYQLDCCAGGRTQMVTTDFWPQLDPFYQELAEDLNMNIPHDQRMGPGDSRPFFQRGIPTGSITDSRPPGMMELLKTYRHTEYDTLDKIDIRALRDAVTIGTISSFRILNSEDWPEHRTEGEIEKIQKI
jgi:hypothetical protein